MKVTILAMSLLLTSCSISAPARLNKTMRTWEGAPVDRLLERWGPPSQVIQEADYRIFVYDRSEVVTYQDPTTVTNRGTRNRPVPVISGGTTRASRTDRWRMFWISPEGLIYKWSWKGY